MDFANSQTLRQAKFILKDRDTKPSAQTLRGGEEPPEAGTAAGFLSSLASGCVSLAGPGPDACHFWPASVSVASGVSVALLGPSSSVSPDV